MRPSISCFLSNLLEVLFPLLRSAPEDLLIDCIQCVSEVFQKEPFLVIKAYEGGFDF